MIPFVWIIEDEDTIASRYVRYLQESGMRFEYTVSANATEVAEFLSRNPSRKIDVILLDLMMDDDETVLRHSGLRTGEYLYSRGLMPDVPVIVVSARANLTDAKLEATFGEGYAGLVPKPAGRLGLSRAVGKALSPSGTEGVGDGT